MKRVFLCAALASAFTAERALAADPPRDVTVSINPWEGAYVGGHIGYSGGTASWTQLGPATGAGTSGMIGRDAQFGPLFGGLDAGYNHVLPSGLLLGVGADFSFPDTMDSTRLLGAPDGSAILTQDAVQIYGALKARVGYAKGDWLFYATAGFAYDRDRLDVADSFGNADRDYFWRPGFLVGGGVEARLDSHWSAKLEYDFLDFAHTGVYLPTTGQFYRSNLQLHQILLGLNYRFDTGSEAEAPKVGIVPEMSSLSLHGQSTIIGQAALPFHSPYVGTNSLNPHLQARDTWSMTGFLGWKPWEGTELYINPEAFQGFGLSVTHGLAGFSNGEAQKAGYNFPHYNTARLFVRQVFGFGGEQEDLEGPNQVASKVDISRLTFTVGKVSIPDLFDSNTYAHDTRTGFMNWSLWEAGAFDYAADQKGYTFGAVAELNQKDWAIRAGYFLLPFEPNSNEFDTRLGRRGQYIAEFEDRYQLFSQMGKLRLTGWINEAYAGSFSETLANPFLNPSTAPDDSPGIAATRRTRTEYGFIGNVEQPITDEVGLFSRVSWRSGQTEIMSWTDIDESASFGGVIKGKSWGRPDDTVGIAGVVNGLSGSYRAYVAAGGLGINIGDGRLNYQTEKIIEMFYSYKFTEWASLSFDYQFVADPGYNADRGPVSIGTVRLHAEF